MAKKRSKKSQGINRVTVALVVLFIVVFAIVRFLDSGRGRVFLFDIGFNGRFESVQENLGERIVQALERVGVERDGLKTEKVKSRDKSFQLTILRAEISPEASLIKVNSAVDKAVRATGGRVRSCREGKSGRGITIEVGTRRAATHRCIIKKMRSGKRADKRTEPKAAIALIVDDFGYFNNKLVRDFLSLDVDLTISVIPGLRYSEKICSQAIEAGKEVLCHMPMEPESGAEDEGGIPWVLVSLLDKEIKEEVGRALKTTPGAVGMNNHMGSRATADRRVMRAVLDVCRKRELFFIDSMVSSHSVISEVAKEVGVRSLESDLFLDNKGEDTRENMKKLLSIAARRGTGIAIIHVKEESLEHMKWFINRALGEGVRFLKVSEMMGVERLAKLEGGRS